MPCVEVEQEFARWFDDNRSEFDAQKLYSHLRVCTECGDLLAYMLLFRGMGKIAKSHWGKSKEAFCVIRLSRS